MARFNSNPIRPKVGARPMINAAGGEAFDRDPRVALASYLLNSTVQRTFYESAEEQMETVVQLVRQLAEAGKLEFAAKAALYARNDFGMRTVTHVVAGEIAQLRGESQFADQRGTWGPFFFKRIVARLDDMLEIAGYWMEKHQPTKEHKTLPAAMKRGFAEVLASAKPHLLTKYNGVKTRSMTLRQFAHLVHPVGAKGSAIYELRAGHLKPAVNREVALTRAGTAENVEAAKAEAWLDLFQRGRVKYMAALKSARHILENAPEAVELLCGS